MKLTLALIVIAGAVGLTEAMERPKRAEITDSEMKAIAGSAYSCGLIDGTVKALVNMGRDDLAQTAREIDAGRCDVIRKLVGAPNQ